MNLIPINDNVIANPDHIECVEQRTSRGVELTYVWISGRSYVLEVPLEEFYKSVGYGENNQRTIQQWAG